MDYKKIIPYMEFNSDIIPSGALIPDAQEYDNNGADGLYIKDISAFSKNREDLLVKEIKAVSAECELLLYVEQDYYRLEDVKKILYAGARKAVLSAGCKEAVSLIEEAASRFGGDRICARIENGEEAVELMKNVHNLDGIELVVEGDLPDARDVLRKSGLPIILRKDIRALKDYSKALSIGSVAGISSGYKPEGRSLDIMELKDFLSKSGIKVNRFESSMDFSAFKKNSDGLVPIIVQDYKTGQVLMLAYMNEEAYNATITTGKMTYFSRSRQELWLKGETSGHFQYVKSLDIDCDCDTILAKVHQIGPACHTGSTSCFFRNLTKKDYDETNPLSVFEDVMSVILDRKEHPKEGSYTNYLFDKGVDKILKKVGEEATEIVIAAKNPDSDELKYEISDFLYHVMVLMAEQGLSWKDITRELADRR